MALVGFKNNMDLQEAIKILEVFNSWRRGDIEHMLYPPKYTSLAIDIILAEVKKLTCTQQ